MDPALSKVIDDAVSHKRIMLVHTAQKLKIADFIGDGIKSVEQIAKYTKTENVGNVERLMYALRPSGTLS